MNRYIHLLGLCFWALIAVSCQDDDNSELGNKSGLLISLANDVEVTTKSTPAELGEPLKAKFKIKVVNDAAPTLKYYDGNYKNGLRVSAPAGTYRLTADYGTNPALALDDPYYRGETTAEVVEGVSTPVSIPCKVANALTSVVFGEQPEGQDFTADFSDYRVEVYVEEDGNHNYVAPVEIKNNGTSAYYRAGTIPTYTFIGTVKETGKEYKQVLSNAKLRSPENFEAGKHCIITLTMAKPVTGLKVDIEKVEIEQVSINETIPLEWLPKPKVEATDAFENNVLSIVETETVKDAVVKLNTAMALQDLKLKFNFADEQFTDLNGEYLLSKAEDKNKIETTLGITLPNIGETGQVIDFTNVVNRLLTNNGTPTDNTVELDVQSNNRWSSEDTEANRVFTLRCDNPNIQVSVDERNSWSREFTVDEITLPEGSKADIKKIKENLIYQYYDGSEWKECESRENVKGRLQQFTARAEDIPTKQYKVRALYRGAVASVSDVTATLEDPTQLPNSDMEEWYIEKKTKSGTWPFKDKTYYTFHPYKEGYANSSWWDTNNDKAQGGTYAMGIWYEGCFASCVSYTEDTHTGSKAALIYLSGCGDGYANSSNIYVGGAMVGSLYIGSYNSGIQEGHSFPSRPSEISFWYKYKPYNTDAFKVEVSLKNGDEIVVSEVYEPAAYSVEDSGYKQATIDLRNIVTNKKVTTICVQFLASNKTSLSENDFEKGTTINYPTIGNWTVHMGSVLKIDDISLIYDK